MIQPVMPEQLLQLINSYNPGGVDKQDGNEDEMETEQAYLTYDDMTTDQQNLIDEVQEEHEDIDEMLAVQCVNELKEEATLGTVYMYM